MHRVRVGAFALEPAPVTNARFAAFVKATGWTTVAEPRRWTRPTTRGRRRRTSSQARWSSPGPTARSTCGTSASGRRAPAGTSRRGQAGARSSGVRTHPVARARGREAYAAWREAVSPPRPSGSTPPAAGSRAPRSPGATRRDPTGGSWPTPGTARISRWRHKTACERPGPHHAGGLVPGQRLRALRHGRQRLGAGTATGGRGRHPAPPAPLLRGGRTPAAATSRRASIPASRTPCRRKVMKGGSSLCADSDYGKRYRPAARCPQPWTPGRATWASASRTTWRRDPSSLSGAAVASRPNITAYVTPAMAAPTSGASQNTHSWRAPRCPRAGPGRWNAPGSPTCC